MIQRGVIEIDRRERKREREREQERESEMRNDEVEAGLV